LDKAIIQAIANGATVNLKKDWQAAIGYKSGKSIIPTE
jgi:hypothetical protein